MRSAEGLGVLVGLPRLSVAAPSSAATDPTTAVVDRRLGAGPPAVLVRTTTRSTTA